MSDKIEPGTGFMAVALLAQAAEVIELRKIVKADQLAMTVNQREQAIAILQTLNEEAANLQPIFNMAERSLLGMALAELAAQKRVDQDVYQALLLKLDRMHDAEPRGRE